jgi:hypothetical protein
VRDVDEVDWVPTSCMFGRRGLDGTANSEAYGDWIVG